MGVFAEGFLAFAKPLLAETDGTQEGLDKALAISQLCYNLALLPEDQREQALDEMRSSSGMDEVEFDAFRLAVVVPMIERHEQMFPRMHQRISAGLSESGPAWGSSAIAAKPREASPRIDRYAPCPCNSGKKYKFCCGMTRR